MRVLYFTVVPLMDSSNGGSICCRNHVRRLAADPEIELAVVTAGQPEWREGTERFLTELGVPFLFYPFNPISFHHTENSIRGILSFATLATFQFPWELQAMNQPHISEGINWAIRHYSSDVLVFDYHFSALFADLPRADVHTALISLNREVDFYKDQIETKHTHHGSLTAGTSLRRLKRFIRKVETSVDQLVTISPEDFPAHGLKSPPVAITPYLDPAPDPWRHHGTSSAFFVGNIGHFPNRLAITWIVQELSPALHRLGCGITLKIVGANAGEVGDIPCPDNLQFLDRADTETVCTLFRTEDMMLCPVQNSYGVKFKSAEALSYGIPMLASPQTWKGLPYVRDVPMLDLDDADASARTIQALHDNPEALKALAVTLTTQQADFIESQRRVWSATLAPRH